MTQPRMRAGFEWIPVVRSEALAAGCAPEDLKPLPCPHCGETAHEKLRDTSTVTRQQVPGGTGVVVTSQMTCLTCGKNSALSDVAELLLRDAWVTLSLDARWSAAYRLAFQRGRVVIAELRVMPSEAGSLAAKGLWSGAYRGLAAKVPPGGLTSRLVKRVKTTANRLFADQLLRETKSQAKKLGDAPLLTALTAEMTAPEARTPKRRLRPIVSDYELATLARAYAEALQKGKPAPLAYVAEKSKLTYSQALGRIHEARRRRLLSPSGGRGRGGGVLTDLALGVLNGASASTSEKRRGKR